MASSLYTQLLAKKLEWKSSNVNFIQIIHISGIHWVCTSNMNSPPGVCDVYDSMPASNSPTLSGQVAAMMKCSEPALTFRYINVQMQAEASDCALFAIAFAVTLCEGDDPHKSSFNQQLMRSHLMECFENGTLPNFLHQLNRGAAQAVLNQVKLCSCIAHAVCHGTRNLISMEAWHSVANVKSGTTRIV